MLEIIGRASSINVRKVLWTAAEIGLAFEFDGDWGDAVRKQRRAELIALNPNDQFPVIIDENGVLWESNTICRYLAAKSHRTDLLPEAAWARACVEQWMDWQATELNPAWRYAFLALVRKAPGFNDPDEIAASTGSWNAKMALFDEQLRRTGAFAAGDTFTLADIVLGLSVHRWRQTPIAQPEFRYVAAYYDRLTARPAFVAGNVGAFP